MNILTKTSIAAFVLLAAASVSAPSFAADEVNVTPGLTAAGSPLGLHGVDPVALLNSGKEVEGSAAYTGTHEGVSYYFSSKANLATFKKDAAKFTPQNGGFCTYGVSVGKKFDGDPDYAAVVDGKLYVFLNEEIFGLYKKDKAGTISKAATNWEKIEHTKATDL